MSAAPQTKMSQAKPIFKGRVISLFTKRVKLPNGYISSLEIIKHPGAVLIIPFFSKDKLVLLRQFRPVIGAFLYELPAGTLNGKENPLSCAKRELLEETGFVAGYFKKMGYIYPVPGYSTEKILIYQAKGLKKREAACEKDEVIESFVIDRAGMRGMFKQGKIMDAKTICALAMCGWL